LRSIASDIRDPEAAGRKIQFVIGQGTNVFFPEFIDDQLLSQVVRHQSLLYGSRGAVASLCAHLYGIAFSDTVMAVTRRP